MGIFEETTRIKHIFKNYIYFYRTIKLITLDVVSVLLKWFTSSAVPPFSVCLGTKGSRGGDTSSGRGLTVRLAAENRALSAAILRAQGRGWR